MTGRRAFLGALPAVTGGLAWVARGGPGPFAEPPDPCDAALGRALGVMTEGVTPISETERQGRMEKARRLMATQRIGAILLEPGTSMSYFTGMHWGLSERPFVAVLPARGQPAFICPGFEEARARERLEFTDHVRVWQEDESPYRHAGGRSQGWRGHRTGKVGIEERRPLLRPRRHARAAPPTAMLAAAPRR